MASNSHNDFATLTPPGQVPKIDSIFDVSAKFLAEFRLWLEQNPPAIGIKNILGFSLFQQQCILTRSVGQTVASATYTLLTWDTETADTAGLHSLSANTNRITIPSGQDGNYLVGALVVPAYTATAGTGDLVLTKNAELTGAYAAAGVQAIGANTVGAGGSNSYSVTVPLKLAGGDYLSLSFQQGSGANATVPDVTNFPACGFWCIRLS